MTSNYHDDKKHQNMFCRTIRPPMKAGCFVVLKEYFLLSDTDHQAYIFRGINLPPVNSSIFPGIFMDILNMISS